MIGTRSIEKSELLSALLEAQGIEHQILNAKYHETEAEIVAQAGPGRQVTVSTNMAGRGTDIKLGEGVAELGGLHVIGTERHEAPPHRPPVRRPLRPPGRPGPRHFFISLDDEIIEAFGENPADRLSQTPDGTPRADEPAMRAFSSRPSARNSANTSATANS